jgi:hypothetical protein
MSLDWQGRQQTNVSVRMAWISFGALPCRGEKKTFMTARVSMLLKSGASLTCFRTCFLPGGAKDLSAQRKFLQITMEFSRTSPNFVKCERLIFPAPKEAVVLIMIGSYCSTQENTWSLIYVSMHPKWTTNFRSGCSLLLHRRSNIKTTNTAPQDCWCLRTTSNQSVLFNDNIKTVYASRIIQTWQGNLMRI